MITSTKETGQNKMNTATLSFPNHEMAKAFTSAWACKTLTGHDVSAKKDDGSFDVKVYEVDEEKKAFIENYVAGL